MKRKKLLPKISVALIILLAWLLISSLITLVAKAMLIHADGNYIVGDGPAEDPNVA